MSGPTLEARVAELVGHRGLTTCTISDALDGMGIVDRVLHHDLRRVSGDTQLFYGVAYPVRWAPTRKAASITEAGPSTWSEVRGFLAPDLAEGTGRVYVAGSGDLVHDAALAGGMSVTYFKNVLGFEGVVLGGAVRDADQVAASDIAVVATGFVPIDTQGAYRVVSVGEGCVIHNVVIGATDWIFSDGNGTVVLRADEVEDVLENAVRLEAREADVMAAIDRGERVVELIDGGGQI